MAYISLKSIIHWTRRVRSLLLSAFAIAYLSVATFNVQTDVVRPGLDASWMYALNALRQGQHIFGRDVVFTYGPLGFLMHPRAIDQNILWAFVFGLFLQISLAMALGLFAFCLPRKSAVWLTVAGLFIASCLGLWEEYLYRIVFALCLLSALLDCAFAMTMCAIAGVLAGILVFTKFSLAISVVLFLAAWTVMTIWLIHPARAVVRVAIVAGSFSLSLFAGIVGLFGNFAYFRRWVALSLESASGYGSAMSQAGPIFEAVVGVALLAALLVAIVVAPSRLRIPLLLFVLPVAIALKHGFVGHTSNASGYFTFLVALASILFLYAGSRGEVAVLSIVFIMVAAIATIKGVYFVATPELTAGRVADYVFLRSGMRNIRDGFNLHQLTESLRAESTRLLAEERLPPRWRGEIRQTPGGTDVIPWELTYLPANGLKWTPSLVLQQYSAYTQALDLETAASLNSPHAPGTILFEMAGLFQRHPVLDNPAWFRAMIGNYAPLDIDLLHNRILFKRLENAPRTTTLSHVQNTAFHADAWVDVPNMSKRIYARISMKPNLLGLLRKWAWKTSPVSLQMVYRSGRQEEFRLLPDTARNGVLLNYFPSTLRDLNDLFLGVAYDKVDRFRVAGPGIASYDSLMPLEWVTDNVGVTEHLVDPHLVSMPEIVSVLPHPSGSSSPELTITAHDALGYRHIAFLQVIINRQMDGRHACYLRYEVNRSILWLMNDSGVGAAGFGTLGADDLIENGQCAINLRDSWVRFGQTDLSLHLMLSGNSGLATPSKVFAAAISEKGQSEWKQFAIWDRKTTASTAYDWDFSEIPPSLSVQANRLGQTDAYTIEVNIKDLNGAEKVRGAEVIINDLQTGREGCYLIYDRTSNAVMLIGDAGTGLAGVLGIGDHKSTHNSYCTVSEAAVTAVSNREMKLTFSVALAENMKSKRMIFASSTSKSGLRRSWRPFLALP